MRKVGIIDLGSNTAKLVVFAYEPGGSYRQVDEVRFLVRLGAGIGPDGKLSEAAYARGLDALGAFRSYCDGAGIEEICATATSAVRDAANGPSFLEDAERRAGIELRVLTGEEEARYGVSAAANSLALDDALVLDVGGGSAQLSLMRSRRYARGRSWPLGAVRTTDAFFPDDPPRRAQVEALRDHVRSHVEPFLPNVPEGLPLAGMGGTIRALAKIDAKAQDYPLDFKHGYELGRDALEGIATDLLGRTVEARAGVRGLAADRADIIAAGAVVVSEFMRLVGASSVTLCSQGIREGLFYRYLLGRDAPALLPDVRDFSVRNLAGRHGAADRNDHVRELALALFDGIRKIGGPNRLNRGVRELIAAAALLHDIGEAVSFRNHHKHGFYLVMSEPLPGFSHREQALIALLVRYHRKGEPDDAGLAALLEPGDVRRLAKLAALLRLARQLDRAKAGRVANLRLSRHGGRLRIEAVPAAGADVRLEVEAAREARGLFERSYGVSVDLVDASEAGCA